MEDAEKMNKINIRKIHFNVSWLNTELLKENLK